MNDDQQAGRNAQTRAAWEKMVAGDKRIQEPPGIPLSEKTPGARNPLSEEPWASRPCPCLKGKERPARWCCGRVKWINPEAAEKLQRYLKELEKPTGLAEVLFRMPIDHTPVSEEEPAP